METNLLTRVIGVYEQISHKTVSQLDLEGNIRDQMFLDSMQMIQFLSLLEEEFKTEFSLSLINARTVSEFLSILRQEVDQNKN